MQEVEIFTAAVNAVLSHQVELMGRLEGVAIHYTGEKAVPKGTTLASRILACELNGGSRLIEKFAQAVKRFPRGELPGVELARLEAGLGEFNQMLEEYFTHDETADCFLAISTAETRFLNLVKGISGADEHIDAAAYAKRVDQSVRDVKNCYDRFGRALAKWEYKLTHPEPKKRRVSRLGLHGRQTKKMEAQMEDFAAWVAAGHPVTAGDRTKTAGARAAAFWARHKAAFERAARGKGEQRGYSAPQTLAAAFRGR